MDEPVIYVLHPDVMQVNTRKNYVRDRMRAALIYISEYMETKCMMTEGRYNNEELLVRLRAAFGHVDQVRDHIDRTLQQDDEHCRKKGHEILNTTYMISQARKHGPRRCGSLDKLDT